MLRQRFSGSFQGGETGLHRYPGTQDKLLRELLAARAGEGGEGDRHADGPRGEPEEEGGPVLA